MVLPVVALALLALPAARAPSSAPRAGTRADSDVDPVALAAATTDSGWTCLLPHRPRPARQLVRGPLGPDPLQVSYAEPAATGPTPPSASPDPTPPDAGGPAGTAASPSTPVDPPPDGSSSPPAAVRPGYIRPVAGLGTGQGQNPHAELTGTLTGSADTESFALPLRAGDVLGVTVKGAGQQLQLRDPRSALVEGAGDDRSTSYPTSSPLPGGGNATIDHVARTTGTHVLTITGAAGAYTATVAVLRPSTAPQRFYLDFRGASVDTRQFGVDTPGPEPRPLSPLSAFLGRWGLSAADEPALARRISATFTADLDSTGVNVAVSDSAQGVDDWGRPGVSRIVVGGTTEEAGIETIGISDSVDPGNFAREETSLVLLDGLSEPASDLHSLNHYLGPSSNRVAFIGSAVGTIAAHEAGHLLGSWHTDPNDAMHNVMDSGDLPGAFGFGPDGIGGTADDTRPSFGPDDFAPDEGNLGVEDTRTRTAVGLTGAEPPHP